MKIDEIIRSKRRTIALEITRDARLVVRAPLKVSKQMIAQAVEQKRDWIQEKLNDAKNRDEKYPPKRCTPGESFLLLGGKYSLCFDSGAAEIALQNGQLVVPARFQADARHVLTAWYKAQADEVLRQRTDYYAAKAGVQYQSLKITSALSRWGSCSDGGRLCFTWRLVMAPLKMIDYVVVHELSHIGHPDHSKAFWQRVGTLMPDFAPRRAWLRENAALLRRDFFAD